MGQFKYLCSILTHPFKSFVLLLSYGYTIYSSSLMVREGLKSTCHPRKSSKLNHSCAKISREFEYALIQCINCRSRLLARMEKEEERRKKAATGAKACALKIFNEAFKSNAPFAAHFYGATIIHRPIFYLRINHVTRWICMRARRAHYL